MDIKDKTIVLTGASGGIGRAIAAELADAGARVVLVARNEARLTALRDELGGAPHLCVPADLSTDEGRQRLFDACDAIDGGISLLINNAGINAFGLFQNQSAETIRNLVDTNLLSPILVCQKLLPLLLLQPQARIVNIGSTFGSIGYPGFSSYCASKFGLRGFTEALRRELADSTVSVSYVAPRATRTSINSDNVVALNDSLGTTMDEPAVVARKVLGVINAAARRDKYIGWPEKLFVRINALLPGLVDSSLRKQLPVIQRFAKTEL
jgi:short-subunit dehydrogenase